LVPWKVGNRWRYEPCVDNVPGLIVSTECNAQTSLSGNLAMIIACWTPISIKYVMFVNPFATNVVQTAQIHCSRYADIAGIDPPLSKSHPAHAYISVVTESYQ
jgi:hypothetical protein